MAGMDPVEMRNLEMRVLRSMGAPQFSIEEDSDNDTLDTPHPGAGAEDDDEDDEDLSFFSWMGQGLKEAVSPRLFFDAYRNFRCYSDLVYNHGSRWAWIAASAYLVTVLPLGMMSMTEEMQRQAFVMQSQQQRGAAYAGEGAAAPGNTSIPDL